MVTTAARKLDYGKQPESPCGYTMVNPAGHSPGGTALIRLRENL
jgi:hypothetical protein